MLVLNFVCESYILLYYVCLYEYYNFLNFHSFMQKRLNPFEGYVIFLDTEDQLQKIFIIDFNEIFIELRCFFNPLKIIYKWLLCHCPSIQFFYVPMLKIWWFFIFIIIFHIFVIRFHILINSMTCSTSDNFFYHKWHITISSYI